MVNHKGTKQMKTFRLTLRPFSINDAEDAFCNYLNDDDTLKNLQWKKVSSIDEAKHRIANIVNNYGKAHYYNWAIEYKNSVIGNIYVKYTSCYNKHCIIEYCLGNKYRNRDLMTESVIAVIDYLFDRVKLNHVIALNNHNNIPSRRVLEKSGMHYSGLLRQHLFKKTNSYADLEVFCKSKFRSRDYDT